MKFRPLQKSFSIAVLLLFLPATQAWSSGLSVPADVIAIYQSNTVLVDAYPWPGMTLRVVVRLASIDVPRTPGQCQSESKRAAAARRFTERQIGSLISLNGVREGDDAGSVRANITTQEGMDLAQMLIESNFARPHDGGESQGWCRN